MKKIIDKLLIPVLLIIAGFFLWKYGYSYFEMRQQEITQQQQKESERKMLGLYTKINTNIEEPIRFKFIEGNGEYMFITQNNKLYNVKCPSKINLSGKNVVKYLDYAPRGLIMYYKDNWYIANISKKYVDKQHTIEHIRECVLTMEMEIQEDISKENLNTRSWTN